MLLHRWRQRLEEMCVQIADFSSTSGHHHHKHSDRHSLLLAKASKLPELLKEKQQQLRELERTELARRVQLVERYRATFRVL